MSDEHDCPNCNCERCERARAAKEKVLKAIQCKFCNGTGAIQDAFGFYPCVCRRYGGRTG